MTTAARPTFEPARGGRGKGEGDLSALSKQYSSRDLPSHTKLKYRQTGQATADELRSRDLRRELEEKERDSRERKDREKTRSFTEAPSVASTHGSSSKRPRLEPPPTSIDADDPVDDEDEDEEEGDSDEDDTAELLRELQKIRKERKEEQEKQERERKEEEERIRTENLLRGNPLLNQQQNSSFKVKRRWDDDVVFKNCAKGEPKNKVDIPPVGE